MPSTSATSNDSRVIFTCGAVSFTARDLIDAAIFRGQLEPIWRQLLRMVAAEKLAADRDLSPDDDAIDTAAEAFRYQYDLITAEETEKWLADRGLTLGDFSDYFMRHYWGDQLGDEAEPEDLDYFSAPNEFRDLLTTELTLSGELDRMAQRLSWRMAARAAADGAAPDPALLAEERSLLFTRAEIEEAQLPEWLAKMERDRPWFENAVSTEALFRRRRESLLSEHAREREIAALRLPLTKFDVETIEFDSPDAAREAILCVQEDGMSMEEVAAEGRYPYRHTEILLEDIPDDLQQKFLSVSPGDVLEPIPHGDGFHLCRIIGKAEPRLDDPNVKNRAEKRILDRHFEDLTSRHIQWRNFSNSP